MTTEMMLLPKLGRELHCFSAALSTTSQTNGFLSSTFALWCDTEEHLRPALITHRNTLLPSTAAAAAATGAHTNW